MQNFDLELENSRTEDFDATETLPPMVISITQNKEVEMISMTAHNFATFLHKLIEEKETKYVIAKAGQEFSLRMIEQEEKQEAHQLWNTKRN